MADENPRFPADSAVDQPAVAGRRGEPDFHKVSERVKDCGVAGWAQADASPFFRGDGGDLVHDAVTPKLARTNGELILASTPMGTGGRFNGELFEQVPQRMKGPSAGRNGLQQQYMCGFLDQNSHLFVEDSLQGGVPARSGELPVRTWLSGKGKRIHGPSAGTPRFEFSSRAHVVNAAILRSDHVPVRRSKQELNAKFDAAFFRT